MQKSRIPTWITSITFVLVGIFLAAILPALLTPDASPNAIRVPGVVESMNTEFLPDDQEPVYFPIFSYTLPDGTTGTFRSDISSDNPIYEVGEAVTVVVDPTNPESAFTENDKNLLFAILIMRIAAAVFLLLGSIVIALLLRGEGTARIHRIGGLAGALSFGIPASFALPALWLAHQARPNVFFKRTDAYDLNVFLLGLLFTVIGLATIGASIAIYRYQAKTGRHEFAWLIEWLSKHQKK